MAYFNILPKHLPDKTKLWKTSVGTAGMQAEIQSWDFQV